jgi:hypothetical protein
VEYGYSILMGIFTAALLLYAGLMAWTKEYRLVPFRARASVKPKNVRAYMTGLAKVVALVAAAPALSALCGLWSMIAAPIVLIVGMIVFLWIGTRIMKGVE